MNILGPTHVLEIIVPKLEEILSILNVNYLSLNFTEEKKKENKIKTDNENYNGNFLIWYKSDLLKK